MNRLVLLIVLGVVGVSYGVSSHPVTLYQDVINTAREKFNYDIKNDYFLIVNTTDQKMYLIKNKIIVDTYIVSTGKAGEGSVITSKKTPLGYHKIADKVGDEAPIGTIFVAKQDTGKISEIYTDKKDTIKDPVITRIFHLDGLEEGYNKGGNVDSYRRGIFIHGTHEEGLLGEKASNGCIRMNNEEVIELYNIVPKNTVVYII